MLALAMIHSGPVTIGANARFITFDCYGTLVNFQMTRTIKDVFGSRLPPERAADFIRLASAFRFDEVLGPWKPYRDVICDSTQGAARLMGIDYRDRDGEQLYDAIGTWGPHADVPDALRALATRYPLVILSNANDQQIAHNVAMLGAPFHKVLTAEQARAYKPRFAAFLYMFDSLQCRPEDIIHVSSSMEYDHRPAADLGIGTRIFVNRGHEPGQPWIGYHEVQDLSGVPALLGIDAHS
jgi:2-haloacid dehalogenase